MVGRCRGGEWKDGVMSMILLLKDDYLGKHRLELYCCCFFDGDQCISRRRERTGSGSQDLN